LARFPAREGQTEGIRGTFGHPVGQAYPAHGRPSTPRWAARSLVMNKGLWRPRNPYESLANSPSSQREPTAHRVPSRSFQTTS
jgi:hypothetical protein